MVIIENALCGGGGKINFLTGVSGTGKTAIANAVEGKIDDLDTRAGADNPPVVTCNPRPSAVDLFDAHTLKTSMLRPSLQQRLAPSC